MERESFMDEDVAEILNENFVAIKVDREERPDIDEIYMTAVQLMTGSGGWPLSVFLKPDLKPFFGGTYFPPIDSYGRPGFKTLLSHINSIWRGNPAQVEYSASNLARAIQNSVSREPLNDEGVDGEIINRAVEGLAQTYDAEWGGFGGAPKFPPTGAIELLLRQYRDLGDERFLHMATTTLDRMAYGGMYDHLGGGFHRYSTDHMWLVPHFEKMLYDNALLTRVYLDAYQISGREQYKRTATETLDFVLRELADSNGGFYSAIDADSEGEEGKYYVWTPAEIAGDLGAEDGKLFCDSYGVSEGGNFEGKSILHLTGAPNGDNYDHEMIGELRESLLKTRSRRAAPTTDDKVLASWNGLMISAFAKGAQILGEERFIEAAVKAAEFQMSQITADGDLFHSYHASDPNRARESSNIPAFLDDYAELSNGLIDLYEATFDTRWLIAAATLVDRMIAKFYDEELDGFFFTSNDHKSLLIRTKPFFDGATPSGNSTATNVLLRLARFLDRPDYRDLAESTILAAQSMMIQQPLAFPHLLCAVDLFLKPPTEITIAGRIGETDTAKLLDAVYSEYLPNRILGLVSPGDSESWSEGDTPTLFEGKTMVGDRATAYVCENYACREPVTKVDLLAGLLARQY